ncbi:unnamed protein product [Clonostachys rhizophaga]|uniref:Glutathione peroxidase n=1 Tax=Clonostachys rhizophaga TaxID=160324 RepID=A0A9N9V591_9HYPO|nr:unnamed protein product [Clonostachys rhizophaga]
MLRNSKSFWPCRGSWSFPLRQSIGLVGQQSGGLHPPAHSPRLLSTRAPTYFSPTLSPLPASRSSLFRRHPSGSFISIRKMSSATSFYDFKPLDKRNQEVNFEDYKGKVVLIINTASKCGFTPQYEGFEKLYKQLREKYNDDVVFLGFPCNQFGGQEPGTNDDIQNFCLVNYGVSFPIMGKVDVNGDNAAPLYNWLKEQQPGILGLKRVKWNFEKFLVGRDGKVKGRWASTTKPDALEAPIVAELEKKDAASNL